MIFEDIIILGPSNTGKTYLGNYIASKTSLPVFNCDSVQIYKYLNSLTSKPEFTDQTSILSELVSKTELQTELDKKKYENIDFLVYENLGNGMEKKEFSVTELKKYLDNVIAETKTQILRSAQDDNGVVNFLFDIKEPLESYSSFDFNQDLKRIATKFNLKQRIIVGGTIYYAYNYIFNIFEDKKTLTNSGGIDSTSEVEKMTFEEMIEFLKEKDPESLEFLKLDNLKRVQNAVKFIKESGKKYSINYIKESKPRDNFILIILLPKDRKKYYANLDQIIDNRLNNKTFEELEFILNKYGEKAASWLEKVSYEYKYFLQIYSLKAENRLESISKEFAQNQKIQEALQTLKYKEHQYAKRQMTFIRRLERKLI